MPTNQDPVLENLVGKSQFKKGSDWWKFSIWNRVMGSQQIRIQLGKILWENLVEKVLMVCNGSKNGKKHQNSQLWALAGNF